MSSVRPWRCPRLRARAQTAGRRALPADLRVGLESLSGLPLGDVRVHRASSRPAELGARATGAAASPVGAPGRGTRGDAHAAVQRRPLPTVPRAARRGAPVVQRLLRSADLAPPKDHVRNPLATTWLGRKLDLKEIVKEQSTRYREVLQALDAFHAYADHQIVGSNAGSVLGQWSSLATMFDRLQDACIEYLDSRGDEGKADQVRQVLSQCRREKVIGHAVARQLARQPPVHGRTWAAELTPVMLNEGRLNAPVDFGATVPTAQVGGAINTLRVYGTALGPAYFKDDKPRILSDAELPQGASAAAKAAALSESGIAHDFGIDRDAPRLSARDVASARLDDLLGGGVTAHAEFALRAGGPGLAPVAGSITTQAPGDRAGDMGNAGRLSAVGIAPAQGGVSVGDPELMRLLSRLQLLDVLSMQADRHTGNFYIQSDAQRRVTGVTGIDLDMSWGTRTAIEKVRQEYPGLSRFVDRELALRILHLDPADLRWALTGLLRPEEIDAALVRLARLQDHLRDLHEHGALLDRSQWTTGVAGELRDEGRSYHARLAGLVH